MAYKRALHIFRRDLRIADNRALAYAYKHAKEVTACFFFDPRQVSKENEYASPFALGFMLDSLEELKKEIEKQGGALLFFWGNPEKMLPQISKELQVDLITWNRDYTAFSQKRDAAMQKSVSVDVHIAADALLHEPEDVAKDDGSPYTVYSYFYKKASQLSVAKPVYPKGNWKKGKSKEAKDLGALRKKIQTQTSAVAAGRTEGKKLLKKMKALSQYEKKRDIPAEQATTHLSAHHKFGTVSIRETYAHAADAHGIGAQLIKELYWRDFFTHIAYHFPHVFGQAFRKKYQTLFWSKSKKKFEAWKTGETGFPIVDAGMRELAQTGYMHNRVRMITASFLVKDLHIDWRWGEKHFAQLLVDYDPAVNNGNWQWAASTGCDAQPYFRIFNPWRQQKRFDPDAAYIKTWVPELQALSAKEIHALEKEVPDHVTYSKQIVEHKVASAKAKEMFTVVA